MFQEFHSLLGHRLISILFCVQLRMTIVSLTIVMYILGLRMMQAE